MDHWRGWHTASRRFTGFGDTLLLLLLWADQGMVSFLSGGIAVLADNLLHVLTPQVSVFAANVMRSDLFARELMISASVAMKPSWSRSLFLSLYFRLLLLLHNFHFLFWLRSLTLSQILLILILISGGA